MTNNTTDEVRQAIVQFVRTHPELTISSIAGKLGIGCSSLSKLLKDAGCRRRQYRKLANVDIGKLEE